MSDQPTTPATEPTEAPATEAPKPTAPEAAPDTGGDKDWKAEAEKWKALSRKHEDTSKANADKARRLDELEEASKTEQQKLEERAAKAEAKAAEIELRALKAEVANVKGVPASLLSGATQEELEASADALLAFRGEKKLPDLGGGDRGGDVNTSAGQLTRADMQKMTSEQIDDATRKGLFNDLLSGKK